MSGPVAVVVEEEQASSSLIKGLLEACGFTVRSAYNGPDGVAAAWRETPTLLTVNLRLPKMDGATVIRRIRKFSDAYILAVAAGDDESAVVTAFEAGADDYVPQPFRPRILQARIRSVQRRPARRDDYRLRRLS